MQSDVPPLPISCLTDNNLRRLRRIGDDSEAKLAAANSDKACTTFVFRNKKNLQRKKLRRPSVVGAGGSSSPYKNSRLAVKPLPDDAGAIKQLLADLKSTSISNERVSSAKMLRIRQLQNQLADAHFHLNELSSENKLLKAIQKRQDAALKRYEGTNAELPRIINTHHEDLRVLQSKYKKLKSQYNKLNDALKEKDSELHSLQAQNRKLLQLSKDRQLGERDQLQTQVSDLTDRINQQNQTIQTLKRKLELETKYLNHQVHAEMIKRKDAQKQLEEAQIQLQQLERLNEQRLKRSYRASSTNQRNRLIAYWSKPEMMSNNKVSSPVSQSLTNLSDDLQSEKRAAFKLHSKLAPSESSTTNLQSLPSLPTSNPSQQVDFLVKPNKSSTPTLNASFESPAQPSSTAMATMQQSTGAHCSLETTNQGNKSELPKSLKREFEYSTDDDDENKFNKDSDHFSHASRSRSSLHSRLVNSARDAVRTINKTTAIVCSRSRSLTKENLENILENERQVKCDDHDSAVTVITKAISAARDQDDVDVNGERDGEVESQMDIPDATRDEADDSDQRKSDVVIVEDLVMRKHSNTSSHLSSLFSHLRKPPSNYSTYSKKEILSPIPISKRAYIANDNADETSADQATVSRKNSVKQTLSRQVQLLVGHQNKQANNSTSDFYSDRDDRVTTAALATSADKKLVDDIRDNFGPEITEKVHSNDRKAKPSQLIMSDLKNNAERRTTTAARVNESATKSFDKAKLLAAMKAIDDNENVESYVADQKPRKNSPSANRLRITENLYRGVPTHNSKSELMKQLFPNANSDN